MARSRKQQEEAVVRKDEKDAEVRYQQSLKEAKEAAEELAADGDRSESKRLAAAETAAALQAIEDARVTAEAVDASVVRKTFAEKVLDFFKR